MPEMQQRGGGRQLSSSPPPTAAADPHIPSPIPPWVHVNTSGSEVDGSSATRPLLPPPEEILPNTRHYRPPPPHYKPGRKWDHLRTAEPAFLGAPVAEAQQRWRPFMMAGPDPQTAFVSSQAAGGDEGEKAAAGRVVSRRWLEQNMPGLHPPWRPEDEIEAGVDPHQKGLMYKGMWLVSPERQEKTVRFFWRVLLKNPFVPLAFRLLVLSFSAAALAISASIYVAVDRVNHDNDPDNQCASRASTWMSIIVDIVALPYIAYVTWDEYMSKPLGLRSVAAKILLLLCDLYFIVFSAANLSLAFDALSDRRWACFDDVFVTVSGSSHSGVGAACPNNPGICHKQKALSSVLLINLLAWLLTFSMSILRVVEKLRPD